MSAVTATPLTVAEIARRLRHPTWRVLYVINTRRIEAASRAGSVRVFSDEQFDLINGELQRMAIRRT
jgi:hypothetical protein